jgi:hypothetical protein
MFFREEMVQATDPRIRIRDTLAAAEVVVEERWSFPGPIGRRPEVHHVSGDGIDPIRWNAISWKWIPDVPARIAWIGPGRRRIVDRNRSAGAVERLGKIALTLCRRRYGGHEIDRCTLSLRLIIDEEKGAVTDDRASHSGAILIALKKIPSHTGAIVLPAVRVEMVVAEKLIDDAVELIGS